jgi:hypothetical protein
MYTYLNRYLTVGISQQQGIQYLCSRFASARSPWPYHQAYSASASGLCIHMAGWRRIPVSMGIHCSIKYAFFYRIGHHFYLEIRYIVAISWWDSHSHYEKCQLIAHCINCMCIYIRVSQCKRKQYLLASWELAVQLQIELDWAVGADGVLLPHLRIDIAILQYTVHC